VLANKGTRCSAVDSQRIRNPTASSIDAPPLSVKSVADHHFGIGASAGPGDEGLISGRLSTRSPTNAARTRRNRGFESATLSLSVQSHIIQAGLRPSTLNSVVVVHGTKHGGVIACGTHCRFDRATSRITQGGWSNLWVQVRGMAEGGCVLRTAGFAFRPADPHVVIDDFVPAGPPRFCSRSASQETRC
jgi:hypothetical protein